MINQRTMLMDGHGPLHGMPRRHLRFVGRFFGDSNFFPSLLSSQWMGRMEWEHGVRSLELRIGAPVLFFLELLLKTVWYSDWYVSRSMSNRRDTVESRSRAKKHPGGSWRRPKEVQNVQGVRGVRLRRRRSGRFHHGAAPSSVFTSHHSTDRLHILP